MPDLIPDLITKHPTFTLWRMEDDNVKVPCTHRGKRARPQAKENPSGLLTYEQASNHALLSSGGCTGLGIVLREQSDLVVIDIDKLEPKVWGQDGYEDGKEFIRALRKFCYVEQSPSGRGFHAICRARLPEGHKTRHKSFFGGRVEVYTRWRFITLTRAGWRCPKNVSAETDRTDDLLPLLKPLLDLGRAADQQDLSDIPSIKSRMPDDDVLMEMAGLRSRGSQAAETFLYIYEHGFEDEEDASDSLHSGVASLVTVTKDKDQIVRILTTSPGISTYEDSQGNPKLDRWIRAQLGSIIQRRIDSEREESENRRRINEDRGYYDELVILEADSTKFYKISYDIDMTVTGVNNAYRHIHTGVRGDPLLGNLLLGDPVITRVAGKTWMPRPNTYGPSHDVISVDGAPYINTWRGFRTKPAPGPVQPWLDLVDHLSDGNSETAWNIVRRIAYDVQHPDEKCSWSLVIIGIHGAGKDSLLMPLSRIFGPSMQSIGNDQVKSQYDDEFAGTKIVAVNEVRGLTGDSLEKIKKMTAKENSGTVTLNIKGGQKIRQQGLWSVYFLTNHHDALNIAPTERRFYVIECASVMPSELRDRYFGKAWLDGTGPSHLLHYLQKLDLSDFNPDEMPSRTQAMEDMIENAELDSVAAIRDLLSEGNFGFNHGLVNPRAVGQSMRERGYRGCRDQDARNVLMQMGWLKIRERPKKRIRGKELTRPLGMFAPKDSNLHQLKPAELYQEIGLIASAGDFLEE